MNFKPEITRGDQLYKLIVEVVKEYQPKTILEIGSANGLGSTQAFVEGVYGNGINNRILKRVNKTKMVCIEADPQRYEELVSNTEMFSFIECINASSVPIEKYLSEDDIDLFMEDHGYLFNIIRYHSKDTVKKWRTDEIDMIKKTGVKQDGIRQAIEKIGGGVFDMVLIDGSAFTAEAEFEMVNGAGVIILDDTMDIKNLNSMRKLCQNDKYKLIKDDVEHRNGYAAFEKKD